MKKTLYLKFILAYIIFGFFGFMVVATFVSSMTMEHLKREKADALYKEATLIANTYASDLYNNETTLESVKNQLDALDTYLSATLWIINPSGRLVLCSPNPSTWKMKLSSTILTRPLRKAPTTPSGISLIPLQRNS